MKIRIGVALGVDGTPWTCASQEIDTFGKLVNSAITRAEENGRRVASVFIVDIDLDDSQQFTILKATR